MSSVKEQKQILRFKAKAACEAIDRQVAQLQDEAILRRVSTLPEYVAAKTLFIFASTPGEIDTTGIIRHALANGKRVGVPKCTAPGLMEIRCIKGMHELSPGSFGIPEPGAGCALLSAKDIDFALVPCAACDCNCNRLGKGGGYYDRALKNRNFPAAALCREAAVFKSIPTEKWDEPMDLVLTEQRVIRKDVVKKW